MSDEIERIASEACLLDELGPRLTGSDAHRKLVEHIASQLYALGLQVHRDSHVFMRWDVLPDAQHLGLWIDGTEIEVSSAYPYSGTTGSSRITTELCFVPGFVRRWGKARGKIAVVEVRNVSVPLDLLFKSRGNVLRHQHESHPLFSTLLCGPWLRRARKAGVRAVICVWRDMTAANAKNQYLPFWEPYYDLPAIWVAGEAGDRVIEAALKRKEAQFLLHATLTPNTSIETVWAVSPGKLKDETLLVVTHTDGTNVLEENGHIAMIELARDAVSRPHNRTFVYVFAARHLRIPMLAKKEEVTSAWLASHPDLWAGLNGHARAVAGLVIEHLGAQRFREDREGPSVSYAATKHAEREILYATTPQLHDIALQHLRNTAYGNPDEPAPAPIVAPRPFIYVGEGEPLYRSRIPAITLATGPQYLLVEGAERLAVGGADSLVDRHLMKEQIDRFRSLQNYLDEVPVASIGSIRRTSFWEHVAMSARILAFIVKVILHFRSTQPEAWREYCFLPRSRAESRMRATSRIS
jgi:hypothetical protein